MIDDPHQLPEVFRAPDPDFAHRIRSFALQGRNERIGATLGRVTAGDVEIEVPVSATASRAGRCGAVVLRSWLDSWAGIGAITDGMAHQGYDLQLTRYDARGWRATFYASGMKHSITGAIGSAFESSSWAPPPRGA